MKHKKNKKHISRAAVLMGMIAFGTSSASHAFEFNFDKFKPDQCETLTPTIIGTEGDDVINGTDGPDIIFGLGGNDIINGAGGDDIICAGDGDDQISGGDGYDRLFGQIGNDEINGDNNADILNGGEGNDLLFGGRGLDTCNGYVGIDSAEDCIIKRNVGLKVKQVKIPVPEGFTPASGDFAGQTFYELEGALFVPKNSRKVAILATHGSNGRFYTSLTGWLGWWMEQQNVTVLALNRRDSIDYGSSEGGGGTFYEDTLCDVGRGVDYLVSLGYEKVIIQGHSKGTTVAPVYPSYYNNCPGKEDMTAANDPNVVGVFTTGSIREVRESSLYAPYGQFTDVNVDVARDLVGRGFSGVMFPPGGFPAPEYPQIPQFGPAFFAQLPFPPFPTFPVPSTPDSYLSYNDNPLRDVNNSGKDLEVPFLIIHSDGDTFTPRVWSDMLYDELLANGNNVSYFKQDYASIGLDPNGAHQIRNSEKRDEAIKEVNKWMLKQIPGSWKFARGIDMDAINSLPDFSPLLEPSATLP